MSIRSIATCLIVALACGCVSMQGMGMRSFGEMPLGPGLGLDERLGLLGQGNIVPNPSFEEIAGEGPQAGLSKDRAPGQTMKSLIPGCGRFESRATGAGPV